MQPGMSDIWDHFHSVAKIQYISELGLHKSVAQVLGMRWRGTEVTAGVDRWPMRVGSWKRDLHR